MELAEWEKLSSAERLSVSHEDEMAMARLAAQELIRKRHWNAESVYIGDRFGETFFYVYLKDEEYADPYPNSEYRFYGFRILFQPLRHKFPGLEVNEGDLYFPNITAG
ncbi:MAG TPA: hypothetical protein VFK24_04825 [Gammaproteobacteria bacterium]|nr:hypothetical protein [Gammaproteobacteria bacterium]